MSIKNFLCILTRNFIICPCFLGKQDPGHSGKSRAHIYLLKCQITPTKEVEITGKQEERLFPSVFYDFSKKGKLKSLEKDSFAHDADSFAAVSSHSFFMISDFLTGM